MCLDVEKTILDISDSGVRTSSYIGEVNDSSCEWSGAVTGWLASLGCPLFVAYSRSNHYSGLLTHHQSTMITIGYLRLLPFQIPTKSKN
jgi:hypothetical protein